ncbi:hypothetical protein HY029_03205 [Candidatus Gottesmanbacteria bacterium]|nr:hypothetical protein [Candidatus Gottesmanbacteria bacterium]
MKKIIYSVFFLSVFIILCFISLYGVIVSPLELSYSVGGYQIAAFERGLAFYQPNTRYFYTFSPFNDYIVDVDGKRMPLYSKDDVKLGKYKSDLDKPQWEKIVSVILKYFNLSSPEISYQGEKNVDYITTVDGNKVIVDRYIWWKNNNSIVNTGTTLTYYPGDFIFDAGGNLYTYQSEKEIESFKKIYGVDLRYETTDLRVNVPTQFLFIINPQLSGVIKLSVNDGQMIWIDRNSRLIDIEQTIKEVEKYKSSVTLEIFDTPQKALKSI